MGKLGSEATAVCHLFLIGDFRCCTDGLTVAGIVLAFCWLHSETVCTWEEECEVCVNGPCVSCFSVVWSL